LIDLLRTRTAALGLVTALAFAACGQGPGATAPSAGAGGTPSVTSAPSATAGATTAAAATTPAATSAAPSDAATTAPAATTPAATTPAASSPAGGETGAPSTPASGLTGSINVSGSSTVQPITAGVAEAFNGPNPGVAITVNGPGTGDGFKVFCQGETDISNASRKIKEEEATACQAAGIEYVELRVAIDGIAVMTSASNTAVECLTFADLYALIGPEAQGKNNWKDVQDVATALGSKTTLPDADLQIFGPGEESGTYDSFVEIVIADLAESRSQKDVTRPDYNPSPNDNVIVQGITGAPTSLGWVGFAFAQEAGENVRLLSIDDGESGCVAPTAETIANGTYPIARDLYIYVNKAKATENPALAAFIDFYLTDGTIASVLEEVSYVNLAPEALAETQAAWKAR
jgi:phosphate transport system substrate-binding protein